MNFFEIKSRLSRLSKENKGLKIIIMMLLMIVFLLALFTVRQEKIITLIPVTLSESAHITKKSASENYISSWALYFALLIGNVTPGNVEFIENALSPLLSPEIYNQVIDVLLQQSEQIKNDTVSLSFQPRNIEQDIPSGKVYVTGYSSIAGPLGKAHRALRTYEFEIKIQNYSPLLIWMTTYEGHPKK